MDFSPRPSSRGRRRLLLALLQGVAGVASIAVASACGDATAPATPVPASPSPSPSPLPSPSPSPSPTPLTLPPLPPIVPGRLASPGPSPSPLPSPVPVALHRPGTIVVEQAGRILVVDPAPQPPQTRMLVSSTDGRAPRWSPDSQHVLFVGGQGPGAELRVVPASGGASQRMTNNSRPERTAAWAPLGERVAYAIPSRLGPDGFDDPAEPGEIWLLDVATGDDRKLVDGFDPAWSPDGRWIAYATNGQRSDRGPRANAIHVVSLDGRDDRPLLEIGDVPADLLPSTGLPLRPQTVTLRAPAWSPDGQRLVASADGHTSLAVTFDVRGQVLGTWAQAFEGGVGRARWSPDGLRLAVESRPATGVDTVIVVDLGSRRQTQIGGVQVGFQAFGPTWAPDGRRLALIAASLPARRGEPVESSIRLYGPDGAEVAMLISAPDLHEPDWGRAP